jgi:hypothetical protein
MHDCKDKDTRRFETVENTEGKTIHKATAHIVVYDRPGIRMIDDALDGSKDLKRQIVAKAGHNLRSSQ